MSAPMQEVMLPTLRDFELVEEDEASSSYEAPRLSYTEKGMGIANYPTLPRSFSTTRMPKFQPKNIPMANTSSRTYKVKLEYFNGQTWIENKIFIDTGASQCHCIPLPILLISATEYNFVTYDDRRSTLNQKAKIMMKTRTSMLLKCDCYIDHSINNKFYHILLGMNFLDQFTTYEIKRLKSPESISKIQSSLIEYERTSHSYP